MFVIWLPFDYCSLWLSLWWCYFSVKSPFFLTKVHDWTIVFLISSVLTRCTISTTSSAPSVFANHLFLLYLHTIWSLILTQMYFLQALVHLKPLKTFIMYMKFSSIALNIHDRLSNSQRFKKTQLRFKHLKTLNRTCYMNKQLNNSQILCNHLGPWHNLFPAKLCKDKNTNIDISE